MKKLEATAKLVSKEFLEKTLMPKVTFEQAKLLIVYQALRDNCWHRRLARESIMMQDRTFKHYMTVLMDEGLVDRKRIKKTKAK